MDIIGILSFFGGVALFLFGMHVMGEAIKRETGGSMEQVLHNLTASRFKGLLLGTGVTAVVQSSAATSVIVLGFLNAGIMTLQNAIPVIMGANIGTCATSWILCLNSISGESLWVRLVSPDCFVPLLAAIGMGLLLSSKNNNRRRDVAEILIGFSVLMYGMDILSGALRPLTQSASFAEAITLFSNPFIGILIGFGITCATQSSSASIGILQAVSATGAITFSEALPIILGVNIGAEVIVVLSAAGGNKDSKRAAAVAMLYNIIGALIVQVAFLALDALFHPGLSNMRMGYIPVAVTHTLYKILIALLLMPFTKQLIALSRVLIRDGQENSLFQGLDERFLDTPSMAIARCRDLGNRMADLARENLLQALDTLVSYDAKKMEEIVRTEELLDEFEDKLGTYMAKLSGRQMTDADAHELAKFLHCIGDFERIGDHALNVAESAQEIHDKGLRLSEEARRDLSTLIAAVREMLEKTIHAFLTNDTEEAMTVEPLEEVIDQLKITLKNRHITRLQHGDCTTLQGFVFSDLLINLERISDHCSNVAIFVIQSRGDSVDTHDYVLNLKTKRREEYDRMVQQYSEKYVVG